MRKRNLSEFMCIEMLYDYKSGKLDPLRKQAVEEGLQASPRVREELRKLSIGISYCEKLKETKVTEPLIDYILNQPKPTEKFLSRFNWNNFPQPVRWAMEAVIVAIAISLFVTQMPELFKGRNDKNGSGLVVQKFDIKPMDDKFPDKKAVIAKSVEIDATEKTPVPAQPTPLLNVAATTATKTAANSKDQKTNVNANTNAIVATSANTTQQPAQSPQNQITAQVPKAEEKPAVKKGNAYLYRMALQSSDVDGVTPQIVQLIKALGGEKAGEVELGWRRKGGSYFHFSLPEANNKAFQDGLKKFGNFSIIKSPHPRVMPPGVERFILWVEEKRTDKVMPKNENEQKIIDREENVQPEDQTEPEAAPTETPGETDAQ